MKYTVARAEYIMVLIEEVNKLIQNGWEPVGGISFTGGSYIQAMVCDESRPIEDDF